MSCAFWEANALNRTLVIDSFAGMFKGHTQTEFSVEAPFAAWYSVKVFDLLPAGGMLYHQFVQKCGAPGVLQQALGDVVIMPSGASHADMVAQAGAPLLVREWDQREQQLEPATPLDEQQAKFGLQVCHKKPEQQEEGLDYSLPDKLWSKWYAKWVYRAVDSIMSDMRQAAELNAASNALVVCLHVRRGDKITSRIGQFRYPNLDYETSPEGILKAIELFVPHGSVLYIATNQEDPVAFFEPLQAHYTAVTLYHFPKRILPHKYLPSSMALVDYEVMDKCDRLIPKFASEESRGFEQHRRRKRRSATVKRRRGTVLFLQT
ncbi:hypothetical protein JKP88DRAFT_279035 [Tribonema minus]|uniref:Uncharacterized protein n=1 Tax=Tribonema minus TaxID=303371 RepID=A0A836CEQ0_9STRA|nr:hypothetical protein JKP88DRAFT_279035 [Tribonema minus]